MTKYWYAVPCQNETGQYSVEGEITDFPRGVFLAYSNCCLVTGLKSKEEAEEWNKSHECLRKRKGD